MNIDYTKLTLGELLSDRDNTVRRNAISILKVMQKRYGSIIEPRAIASLDDLPANIRKAVKELASSYALKGMDREKAYRLALRDYDFVIAQ